MWGRQTCNAQDIPACVRPRPLFQRHAAWLRALLAFGLSRQCYYSRVRLTSSMHAYDWHSRAPQISGVLNAKLQVA